MATVRLAHGLSSVVLESANDTMYGLKTPGDVKKFEELNGFKVTPDYDNMNENSMAEMMDTVTKDLRQLSYASWNVKDLQSHFENQNDDE